MSKRELVYLAIVRSVLISETNTCGSAVFRLFFPILVVASGVDSSTRVSWILLQCAATTAATGSDRGRGVEATRNTNKHYKTPFTTCTAGERTLTGRKSTLSKFAFSSQECKTTVI